jgi:hypothetical protein
LLIKYYFLAQSIFPFNVKWMLNETNFAPKVIFHHTWLPDFVRFAKVLQSHIVGVRMLLQVMCGRKAKRWLRRQCWKQNESFSKKKINNVLYFFDLFVFKQSKGNRFSRYYSFLLKFSFWCMCIIETRKTRLSKRVIGNFPEKQFPTIIYVCSAVINGCSGHQHFERWARHVYWCLQTFFFFVFILEYCFDATGSNVA